MRVMFQRIFSEETKPNNGGRDAKMCCFTRSFDDVSVRANKVDVIKLAFVELVEWRIYGMFFSLNLDFCQLHSILIICDGFSKYYTNKLFKELLFGKTFFGA